MRSEREGKGKGREGKGGWVVQKEYEGNEGIEKVQKAKGKKEEP